MAKIQKRISEFQLPEEIIHHIQSFLDGREAARTTLLSKQWHGAWSTRPNLNFDQHHFRQNEFAEFTKKTMQRYEDQNLKIDSLSLRIKRCKDHPLAAKLISKAIKLGATHLQIQFSTSSRKPFVLPDEVFQSETLIRLSLDGCTLGLLKKEVIPTCSNLKSLKLSRSTVTGKIFRDLILRCALIEELTLEGLKRVFNIGALIELHKLKYLRLEKLDMGESLYRSDLWPKFGCLKELVILNFSDRKHRDLSICSTSLERITIRNKYSHRKMNAEFDVPNIRMFRLEGYDLQFINLNSSSREWEADVYINCRLYSNAGASWFSSLSQLVRMLGRSRLSLSIFLYSGSLHGYVEVGDDLEMPELENLTIRGYGLASRAFLEALFCSCRPNFVNIEKYCVFDIEQVSLEGFPKLQSLKTLLSRGKEEFIRFQLK